MNLPTELNIKITHEGSTIRLSLPELGIATTADDLWEALGNLKDELSEGFLVAMDANGGQHNDFIEACVCGEGDEMEWFLEDARWQRRKRILGEALARHYPSLKGDLFIQTAYPSHADDGEENAERENIAQDELMASGPGPLWLSYIRDHAEWSYWEYRDRAFAAERYQSWLDQGFELRSIGELEAEGRPPGVTACVDVIRSWGELNNW